jgi:hypothetical protein
MARERLAASTTQTVCGLGLFGNMQAGRLVTAAELRNAIWPDTYVSEGLLRGSIREVRQILGDEAETPRYIETILDGDIDFSRKVVSGMTPTRKGGCRNITNCLCLCYRQGSEQHTGTGSVQESSLGKRHHLIAA